MRRQHQDFGNYFMKAVLLMPLGLLAFAACARAGTIDASVVGMFPKDSGSIGYTDLSQARELSWYPQLEAQVVPVALFGFEQFLENIQMTQSSPIDQVAWAELGAETSSSESVNKSATPARGGGQPVGVAIGNFDIGTIET